jgi:hypothetical protein
MTGERVLTNGGLFMVDNKSLTDDEVLTFVNWLLSVDNMKVETIRTLSARIKRERATEVTYESQRPS